MTTQAEILAALQFDMTLLNGPINTTGAPAYIFQYQFAGNSQPGDLWNTYTGWTALTTAEKNAVRAAMDHIETFLNVSFVEIAGAADPDMNIGKVSLPGSTAGYGGYQYSAWSSGTLADYDGFAVYDNTINLAQTSQMGLILHELGHALGLKHPFSGDTLPAAEENNKYSVMSYTANPDTGQDADAMMLYDIFALQDRWGANTSHNSGDTLYTGPRNTSVDPLWDGGGNDTLDGSGAVGSVRLDLRAGRFSRYGTYDDIVIPIGVVIENATGGAGNDTLTGNVAANILTGNGGGDLIFGGDGFDTLIGNGGNDTVWGGNGRDKAFLGDGNDRFEDNTQVGDFAHDTVFGGGGHDTIIGGGGNDVFDGSWGDDLVFGYADDDLLTGGDGFDTLDGGTGNDTVWGGNGRDLVRLSNGADIFHDNTQIGDFARDTVFGGNGHDTIQGGGGNDKFHGGSDNDLIYGRAGDDLIFGDDGFDTIDAGDGNDTVHGGDERDKVLLGNGADAFWDTGQGGGLGSDTVFGGNGHDTLTGGGGNDHLHGEAGNDRLFGWADNDLLSGGLGSDTLTGGVGADTFLFYAGFGPDVITDYTKGVDILRMDDAIWGGGMTATQVISTFVTDLGSTLRFDFGGGNVLWLNGIADSTGLAGDLDIF